METRTMIEPARACHPWVAQRRGRLRFALQGVAGMPTIDPGEQLIRLGTLAEKFGYDAFFLGDHPAVAPECWLHLAAVACRTQRIGLGPMVTAMPYRPPLLTARLAADLDRLSQGRLVLGLGIGWNRAEYGLGANEFAQLGLRYQSVAERQAALEEAISLMRAVWTSNDPVSFQGDAYQVEDAEAISPFQAAGPPIVIAGSGDRTLRQVARFADACNFGGGPAGKVNTPAQARERLAALEAHCRAIGRPYEDILKTHFTHWLILAEDEARAAAKVRRYFSDGIEPFWQDLLVWGTPQSVARRYREFADAGVEYFVLQTVDPGDEETIRLAAEALAPMVATSPEPRA